MASEFVPVNGVSAKEITFTALQASVKDETPEGRSIVELANKLERVLVQANMKLQKLLSLRQKHECPALI